MVDFSKVKPSTNFEDRTDLLYSFLAPWDNWSTGMSDTGYGRGPKLYEILRQRMRNEFLRNFFMEGGNRAHKNFNFHQEDFDTHSNLRKKSRNGPAYDNY